MKWKTPRLFKHWAPRLIFLWINSVQCHREYPVHQAIWASAKCGTCIPPPCVATSWFRLQSMGPATLAPDSGPWNSRWSHKKEFARWLLSYWKWPFWGSIILLFRGYFVMSRGLPSANSACITTDTGPFIDDFPWKLVAFHSYLKLPENNPAKSHWIGMKSPVNHHHP